MEGMPTINENDEKYSDAPFEKYGQNYSGAENMYKTAILNSLMHKDDTLWEDNMEMFKLLPIEVRDTIKQEAEALVAKDNALKGI